MRKILKIKRFNLPIYACRMIFVYSNDFKLIHNFAKGEGFHEDNLKDLKVPYAGMTFEVEDDNPKLSTHYYVMVKKDKNKYEEIDTIAHEITHCTARILEGRNIVFSENEEAYAYLTGYLNKEFHKFKDGKE